MQFISGNMGFAKILVLFIIVISVSIAASLEDIPYSESVKYESNVTELEPFSNKWKTEVQEAVVSAGDQLQKNMLFTLTTLVTRGFAFSRHSKHLLGRLIIGIIENSFNFARMVGSLPNILVEDFPTQFVQVLKIMQKEPRLSKALMEAMDRLIDLIEAAQASGVSQLLFKPVTRVIPNLLSGISRFLVVIFDGVFYLIGARDSYGIFLTTTPKNPILIAGNRTSHE